MQDEPSERRSNPITKNLDFKVPVWGVVCFVCGVGWTMVSNHFAMQQLIKDVTALQISVSEGQKASALQSGAMASTMSSYDVAIAELRVRITNQETVMARIQGLPYNAAQASATARATARAER